MLMLDFVTVQDYLMGLEWLCLLSEKMGLSPIFYLAAAVSDFYLPEGKMVTHKI